MKKILLVEPGYKNKYPPLGLMKISRYHKQKGDHVEFAKGMLPEKRDKFEWDRIYVSSLFTFDWNETIKTLKYYRYSVKEPTSENLLIGGVLATLMAEDICNEVNCCVVRGLLDTNGKIGYQDDGKIDSLVPDYSILTETEYNYPTANAYIVYSTRGCIRKCDFCAVPKIEPMYRNYLPIKKQINEITKLHGPKKDLLLLDNNVLASKEFEKIIRVIKNLGFERGATYSYKNKLGHLIKSNRYVDFNQGLDVRLLSEENMSLLSEIAIKPLRIAFDDINYKVIYEEKVRLAAKYKIRHLSNYILYNFKDKPEDFYHRMKINLDLNEELGLQIYSFPMRYINLTSKDRNVNRPGNIGQNWNKKYLRAVQCVLNATRGIVGTKKAFFQRAFGKDLDEYKKILLMPEDYIINRDLHRDNGTADLWWKNLKDLSTHEKEEFYSLVLQNNFRSIQYSSFSKSLRKVLAHYLGQDYEQLYLELSDDN